MDPEGQRPPVDELPINQKGKLGFIKRHRGNARQSTVPEQQQPEHTDVQKEWIANAMERNVPLDSLNIKNLPVKFHAIDRVAGLVNKLKSSQLTPFDISQLRPPSEASFAIPMVASVAANKENPAIPVETPTADEIKKMKPWVGGVARVLGKFSPSLEWKFNKYVEKKGKDVVQNVGSKIDKVATAFEDIKRPQEQFVDEMHRLYGGLVRPQTEYDSHKIEVRMRNFLVTLRSAAQGHTYDTHWFNSEAFPLITKILPIVQFPSASVAYSASVPVVASELMSGIEQFLRNEGKNVKRAPKPSHSLPRFFAEWFRSEQLNQAEKTLPLLLRWVKFSLPEDGPAFSESVHVLTENIVVLRRQGKDPKEIVDAIFPRNP